MNRRSFFRLLGGALAACAVPLPKLAQRGYRYVGTVTGRWSGVVSSQVFERAPFTVDELRKRSVFKDVPLTIEQARKRRASEIRYRRDEILGVREELKREQQKLTELRAKPLETTGTKIVQVGPDDPDYNNPGAYAGDFGWVNRPSPWLELLDEKKPFPSNMA